MVKLGILDDEELTNLFCEYDSLEQFTLKQSEQRNAIQLWKSESFHLYE